MMTLKDGKFYENGVLIPIQFGNNDQIKLLDKSRAIKTGVIAMIGEALNGIQELSYVCICGCHFKREFTAPQFDEFESEEFNCEGCSLKYTLTRDEDYGFPIVKLRKVL